MKNILTFVFLILALASQLYAKPCEKKAYKENMIFLVLGPVGIGKSTVLKQLEACVSNSVHLDVDPKNLKALDAVYQQYVKNPKPMLLILEGHFEDELRSSSFKKWLQPTKPWKSRLILFVATMNLHKRRLEMRGDEKDKRILEDHPTYITEKMDAYRTVLKLYPETLVFNTEGSAEQSTEKILKMLFPK